MTTEKLMIEAKAAAHRRATVLASKILKTVNEGASVEVISTQIAAHIMNVEWPAAAALFVDMEASDSRR